MNKHLKLVREINDAFSFPQAGHGENVRLSEMDIILRQALLMEEGSLLLRAIKAGEMTEILAGMVNLSCSAWVLLLFKGRMFLIDQYHGGMMAL
jgi:hypothetical protein